LIVCKAVKQSLTAERLPKGGPEAKFHPSPLVVTIGAATCEKVRPHEVCISSGGIELVSIS